MVAMEEVGRCPRERPSPSPDTARMASAAIGDVAAESRMKGVRGDSELIGGEASEVVAEVFPFAVVVTDIMFFWRGRAGARGLENRGREKGEVRNC